MNLLVPVYVKDPPRGRGGGSAEFTVRPLFRAEPANRDVSLRKALGRLRREIRLAIRAEGEGGREDAAADWAFHPAVREVPFEIEDLRDAAGGPFRGFAVTFPALDRRVGWLPDLGISFAIERGEDATARAVEVARAWFRRETRREGGPTPAALALQGRVGVVTVEIEYEPAAPSAQTGASSRLSIGPLGPVEGWRELEATGTDLGERFPDELERVVFREAEVGTLERLLDERIRRPVLLLGAPGVGKTGIVHEYVWRRRDAERRLKVRGRRGSVWHLPPQRLISGMSYVGQWEQRVHAILECAEERRHVLFFDDLVGLFHAGLSAGSRLTVGHVLKEAMERSRLRVVGETTPEGFRALRELDRGFADLFRVLPVDPLDEGASARVLIRTARALERGSRRILEPGAIPAALRLQQRYNSREALPGKAVRFLRRVHAARREGTVDGASVLDEFARASGLHRRFLDARSTLDPAEVRDALRTRVIGQEEAVEAMVDVVVSAKARLNDPGRPLGSLLFLGPTGVGKTECARALTTWLFGSVDRMLRFDMNEFVEPGSAARLSGDRWRPEGLLTAAIRQQPFAVVLFDEIEKAHPEVHDLLLQVLGEGRLTNARGETADFSNAVLLFTSNLGAEEASSRVGLLERAEDLRAVYAGAAERFFRPEFFNRFDRVVPFRALARAEVDRIASVRLREILGREGFARRQVILQVHPWAMERVADAGYHPRLGARALKRELEERIAKPAAARLATLSPDRPLLLRMFAGPSGVVADVRALQAAPAAPAGAEPVALPPEELVRRLARVLARVEAAARAWKPHGAVAVRALGERERLYFALHDRIEEFRRRLARASDRIGMSARRGWGAARIARGHAAPQTRSSDPDRLGRVDRQAYLVRLAATDRIEELAAEVAEAAAQGEHRDPYRLAGLRRTAAHLDLAARAIAGAESAHALLLVREATGSGADCALALLEQMARVAGGPLAGEALPARTTAAPGVWALPLAGPGFARLFAGEEGIHLVESSPGRLVALEVRALPVPDGASSEAVARDAAAEHQVWLERLRDGLADVADDPFSADGIVRFHRTGAAPFLFDLRTGLALPAVDPVAGLREAITAGLPEPPELQAEERLS